MGVPPILSPPLRAILFTIHTLPRRKTYVQRRQPNSLRESMFHHGALPQVLIHQPIFNRFLFIKTSGTYNLFFKARWGMAPPLPH